MRYLGSELVTALKTRIASSARVLWLAHPGAAKHDEDQGHAVQGRWQVWSMYALLMPNVETGIGCLLTRLAVCHASCSGLLLVVAQTLHAFASQCSRAMLCRANGISGQ